MLRPAFDGKDSHCLARQILGEAPTRLEKINSEIPRDLVTVVHKAIDRDASCRYQTARELADDLARFINDQPIQARRPWPPERVLRWARRNTRLAAALMFIAALLIMGTIGSSLAAVRFRRLAAEAVASQRKADQAAERERWERYRSDMAASASALQLNNIRGARAALDVAPPEYRNWEWPHLANQLDSARSVLKGHASSVRAVAFSPDGRSLATVRYVPDLERGIDLLEIIRFAGPNGRDIYGEVVGDDPLARPPVVVETQWKGRELLRAMG